MTLRLAAARSPWWRPRPGELALFARIVAVGAPLGFLAGAMVAIFLTGPAPAPAERGTLASVPGTPSRVHASPARPARPAVVTPPRRVTGAQPTRSPASSPPGAAPTLPVLVEVVDRGRHDERGQKVATTESSKPKPDDEEAPASSPSTSDEQQERAERPSVFTPADPGPGTDGE